jgi:signal transduction histidine kinase
VFAELGTAAGLSSTLAYVVLEDRFGRTYVGTERGIDIFDEDGRRVRHFDEEDGLPHRFTVAGVVDDEGTLWFGTTNGLSRFRPAAVLQPMPAPRVVIDRLHVAGVELILPAGGTTAVSSLRLGPNERSVQVQFVGLPRSVAATLQFQYRLSSDDPWSEPSSDRSIVVAGLASGRHRVEIRGLDAAGTSSPETAVVSLHVLAPVYQRPWFVPLAAAAVVLGASLAYRARVRHLTALERQRTHIAMDLHDQLGSELGSIGLLADLAAEAAKDERSKDLLGQIAETAADMGTSLSDIVWSLRRGDMTIEDLSRHLAGHGRRLFPENGPATFESPPSERPRVRLSPAAGRAVLLVGLEALHNAARHAGARHVTLALRPAGRRWQLVVSDDGRGIPLRAASGRTDGFGFETMRRRADAIGAVLEVQSSAGEGTIVSLTFDPGATDRRLAGRMHLRTIWKRGRST